jgi:hypothetical protein
VEAYDGPALVVKNPASGQKADLAVLGVLKCDPLHPMDFTIRDDGVVKLNPELARRVAHL